MKLIKFDMVISAGTAIIELPGNHLRYDYHKYTNAQKNNLSSIQQDFIVHTITMDYN
jgi:hypothetical protein